METHTEDAVSVRLDAPGLEGDLRRLAARVLAAHPEPHINEWPYMRLAIKLVAVGLVSGCTSQCMCNVCRRSKAFVHFARSDTELSNFLRTGMCSDCHDGLSQKEEP